MESTSPDSAAQTNVPLTVAPAGPRTVVKPGPGSSPCPGGTAFGCPQDYRGRRFVYTVVSPRARGLSVGVNMNPDRRCNLDCVYCEVDRTGPPRETVLDVDSMAEELLSVLEEVHSGRLTERPAYANLPADLLRLRHVALSGGGEPTLCPNFAEAVQGVIHVRARGKFPFFKLVLITNGTGTDSAAVKESLRYFTKQDEIWAKLDVGSPGYFQTINRPEAGVTLDQILANILALARQRPVVIQSLFPLVNGREAPAAEVERYAQRLLELKGAGAQISLVQIYSATRPIAGHDCSHLPLRSLSQIAQNVRQATGLTVEVY